MTGINSRSAHPKTNSDILKAYEEWAPLYDNDVHKNPAVVLTTNLTLPWLSPRKQDEILEIECGTGRLTLQISKSCKKIIGIDFSEGMLTVARKKARGINNVEFRQFDVRNVSRLITWYLTR